MNTLQWYMMGLKAVNPTLTDGLVNFYKFEELSGSILADSFGASTNNLTNLAVSLGLAGKIGYSVGSVGASSNANSVAETPITGNFTINVWLYRTGTQSDNYGVLDRGRFGNGFGIWINSANQIAWRINSTFNNYASTALALNTWTMVSIVYNGSTVKIYYDAVEVKSSAWTTNPVTSNELFIFRRGDGAYVYNGRMDLLSFYNVSKSPTDISYFYNSGAGKTI